MQGQTAQTCRMESMSGPKSRCCPHSDDMCSQVVLSTNAIASLDSMDVCRIMNV
jgi:hypothetical protein